MLAERFYIIININANIILYIYQYPFQQYVWKMKIDSQFQKIEINKEQLNRNAWGYKDYSSCSIEDLDIQKKNNERNKKISNFILIFLLLLFIGQLVAYVIQNNTGYFTQLNQSSIQNLQVTVVIPNAENAQRLRKCLESFFTYNTYPIKKIIVAGNGKKSQQIHNILSLYPEIVSLYTQKNVGEVVLLDMVMKLIDTEYYFTAYPQFQFIKKGFIEKSLEIMELNHNLGSAALTTFDMDWGDNCSTLIDGVYCGFSFLTAMHRKSDYDNLPEDYAVLTGNYSYGSVGGDAKFPIIYHYYLMGKRTFYFFETFISRIGYSEAGKIGYRNALLLKDYDSLNASQKGEYTVAYSWSQMFKFYNENMDNVNRQYSKGFVGKPISGYKIRGKAISQFGVDKQIQAGTQFDYLNISKSDYYNNFVQEYSKLAGVEKPRPYNSEYKSTEKLNSLLKNQLLSILCITIKGSQEDFSSPRFQSLLRSFSKQAFSDVFITIFSNSKSKPKIEQKIKKTKLSDYVYRIYVYEDTHSYGSVGLSYLQKKICPRNSVIINLKPTDRLLNSISLKFVKKAYENPNLMFATFKSKGKKEQIENLDESIIGEFRQKNQEDLAPFLKTYRHQMTFPNIISYLTEFVYNESSQSFHPNFYSTQSEDFHAYSLIQMAGPKRVKFFDDVIIERQEPILKQKCRSQKEDWTKTKAKIKTPIEPIDQFYYPVKSVRGYTIPNKIVLKLRTAAQKYQSCLNSTSL